MVINWPNFIIVISGKGRHKEGERGEGMVSLRSSQKTHLLINFSVSYGCSSRHPKTITIVLVTPMMIDHRSL